MNQITLSEYLKITTQEAAATALGLTQGAIHQMIKAKRDIHLIVDKNNCPIRAFEIKPIGKIRPIQIPSNRTAA